MAGMRLGQLLDVITPNTLVSIENDNRYYCVGTPRSEIGDVVTLTDDDLAQEVVKVRVRDHFLRIYATDKPEEYRERLASTVAIPDEKPIKPGV